MTLPGRRLKKYHPRRSRKVLSIQKQEYLDCLHTLDLEAGKLIVLCKEGSVNQIQEAQNQARKAYQHYKDQLLELAGKLQESVRQRSIAYLQEYHRLVDSALSYDEAIFENYYHSLLKLKALATLKMQSRSQDQDKQTQSRSA